MVIRMRATRSARNNRRSHHALVSPALSKAEGGVVHLRHRASLVTGKYRGMVVIDVEKKLAKKAKKTKEAEAAR